MTGEGSRDPLRGKTPAQIRALIARLEAMVADARSKALKHEARRDRLRDQGASMARKALHHDRRRNRLLSWALRLGQKITPAQTYLAHLEKDETE